MKEQQQGGGLWEEKEEAFGDVPTPASHDEPMGVGLVEQLLRQLYATASDPEGACCPHVVNAYLFGSRAHGLATPQSDYDVLAVVSSPSSPSMSMGLVGVRYVEFPEHNLSVTVMPISLFHTLLQQNVVWVTTVRAHITSPKRSTIPQLICRVVIQIFCAHMCAQVLFLPAECVWREEERVGWELRKQDLRRVVLADIKQQLKRHKWKGSCSSHHSP